MASQRLQLWKEGVLWLTMKPLKLMPGLVTEQQGTSQPRRWKSDQPLCSFQASCTEETVQDLEVRKGKGGFGELLLE